MRYLLRLHEEHLPPLPDTLQLLVGQSSGLTLAVHGDSIQLVEAGRNEEIPQVIFLSRQRILALRAGGQRRGQDDGERSPVIEELLGNLFNVVHQRLNLRWSTSQMRRVELHRFFLKNDDRFHSLRIDNNVHFEFYFIF